MAVLICDCLLRSFTPCLSVVDKVINAELWRWYSIELRLLARDFTLLKILSLNDESNIKNKRCWRLWVEHDWIGSLRFLVICNLGLVFLTFSMTFWWSSPLSPLPSCEVLLRSFLSSTLPLMNFEGRDRNGSLHVGEQEWPWNDGRSNTRRCVNGIPNVEAQLSNEMRLRAPRKKTAENATIVNHRGWLRAVRWPVRYSSYHHHQSSSLCLCPRLDYKASHDPVWVWGWGWSEKGFCRS